MEPTSRSKRILTLLKYYAPGYKAGGPITTVANSVDHLSGRFQFRIVTSDRDLGDAKPYSLPLDRWMTGRAQTMYLSAGSNRLLFHILRQPDYDVLYLNSFFAYRYSILPMLWRRFMQKDSRKVVLAPRGEFSIGALSIKPFRKRLYIVLAKLLRVYDRVVWQASSQQEKRDIVRIFGSRAHVAVAPDLPSAAGDIALSRSAEKRSGELKLVFLSRISRMKNLDFALESLRRVKGNVVFHIYGPVEDEPYWQECLSLIEQLPSNIAVEYCGAVKPNDIRNCLAQYDVFYLPTRGEGFGHAIFEALQSGCALLISDRSPWNDIEARGAGFVLPLDSVEPFADRLERFIRMDAGEWWSFSSNAQAYSRAYVEDSSVLQAHIELF